MSSICKPYDFALKCLGYIYLIREREFANTNQNVYKVGRTVQKGTSLFLDRLKAYKKESELHMIRKVPMDRVAHIEARIIALFKQRFEKHPDGNEYFIGNVDEMIDIINDVCCGK